ncbi:hypothetical protein Tco_0422827 [Tanacetum coccineum]
MTTAMNKLVPRRTLVPGATPEHQCPVWFKKRSMELIRIELELLRKEKLYAKVTYLHFIANFSKIVKPITSLTERDQKYE